LPLLITLTSKWFISAGAIEKLIVMDASYDMVQRCQNDYHASTNTDQTDTMFVVGDEEFLPIKEKCGS
jgi:NADH dehydrogenase [ubiquinone] 1 alpha subcomplex assembly factor 5